MWSKFFSTAGSIMGGFANNYAAKKMAEQDRLQNYLFGEQAANAADERFRKQYLDLFSPSAQMKQLKEAGLSPALAYGNMSGSGGATAPQGGGASGMQTPYFPTTALTAAQVANINADTKKKVEEANTISGNNERGKAEIHKLWQESTSMEVANKYTEAQTTTQNWVNYITSNTASFSIREASYKAEQAAHQAEELYWQARKTKQDFEYNQQVFDTRVQAEKQSFINLQMEAILKQSQNKLTEAQTELVKGELSMLYDTSMREWAQLDVNRADQEKRAELIDKEVANFERKLEQTDKSLRIQNRNSWFNNINSSIRTIFYGASSIASFLPMSGGTPIPPILESSTPSGLNQFY